MKKTYIHPELTFKTFDTELLTSASDLDPFAGKDITGYTIDEFSFDSQKFEQDDAWGISTINR